VIRKGLLELCVAAKTVTLAMGMNAESSPAHTQRTSQPSGQKAERGHTRNRKKPNRREVLFAVIVAGT